MASPENDRSTVVLPSDISVQKQTAQMKAVVEPNASDVRRPLHLVSDAELADFPDPEYLLEGFIEEGSLSAFYGPSGAGKTFVLMDMAMSIVTGMKWMGKEVKQGPVIYVVGEGQSNIKKRATAWKRARGVPVVTGMFYFPLAVQLLVEKSIQELLRDIDLAGVKPALIIFDTLAACFVGGDENAAQDMGKIVEACRQITRRTGAAVVLVHHSGKAGKKGGTPVERGSSALGAGVDAKFVVERDDSHRDGRKHLTLTTKKQKDDEEAKPIHAALNRLTWVGGNGKEQTSCVLEGIESGGGEAAVADGIDKEHREALQALVKCGGVGVRTADWQKAFRQEFGQSDATFNRRRKWLVKNGYIERHDNRKGHYSVTPLGQSSVKEQSRGLDDLAHVQSQSHPVGVTRTADGTDDNNTTATAGTLNMEDKDSKRAA
jgi:AAA domain-containing protein